MDNERRNSFGSKESIDGQRRVRLLIFKLLINIKYLFIDLI